MPKNHVMLDLETLSTRKHAAVIQLAARAFDPETGELGESFCAYVYDPSGYIDPQTVAWWFQQAQAPHIGACVADDTIAEKESDVLASFAHWIGQGVGMYAGVPIAALWSHSATFDIVVLENTYERAGLAKPWSYKIERDTRTLYAIAPGGMPAVEVDESRKHDATYDCEVQIAQVVGALRALRIQSNAASMHRDYVAGGGADTERAAVSYDQCEDAYLLGPNMYDVTRSAVRAAPAAPTWERPPVWTAAESRTEAYANPTAAPECVDTANPCAFGECGECQVARGEDPKNYAPLGLAEPIGDFSDGLDPACGTLRRI